MKFLEYVIPLIASCFTFDFLKMFVFPVLCLCVCATVPVIIRNLVRFR